MENKVSKKDKEENTSSFYPFANYVVRGEQLNKLGIKPEDVQVHPHTGQVLVWWDLESIAEDIKNYHPDYEASSDDRKIEIEQEVVDDIVYNSCFDGMADSMLDVARDACRQVWEDYQESLKENK